MAAALPPAEKQWDGLSNLSHVYEDPTLFIVFWPRSEVIPTEPTEESEHEPAVTCDGVHPKVPVH
ncbi:hypothetical protein PAL_GLEAN10017803 [Pteropus alecto]|uniref:Uncharacterized protein n=1 Tax=Pteropus alecto TaxID=9402 RepID=L5KYK9_PTEAL|nr:hypothetical protein PAL_GLEAN10017803 [Pteropus alecto]